MELHVLSMHSGQLQTRPDKCSALHPSKRAVSKELAGKEEEEDQVLAALGISLLVV